MVNDIITAIGRALDAAFGEGYTIYSEDVPQGLKEPCFCIQALGASQRQYAGPRYRREHPFDILYFPSEDSRAEVSAVQERLMEAMEVIELPDGGLLRGTGMRSEIVDSVGHFLVDYNMVMKKPTPMLPRMEELEFYPKTKE